MTTIDMHARYRVAGHGGVAFYIKSHAQTWEPWTTLQLDDDGNECEVETGDGEWFDDTDNLIMIMVGDDCEHIVSVDDITALDDDEYCGQCGQIGCTHDGRSTEEDE